MSRTIGIIITAVWLACMGALIQRDVWPYWQAQDPPERQIPDGAHQVGILNSDGRRVGTTWVRTIRMAGNVTVQSLTQLEVGEISNLLPMAGSLFLDSELSYSDESVLDGFEFRMESAVLSARVKGTRFEGEFACIAEIGGMKQSMALDTALSRFLGDSLRPFTHLEGIQVGQSWRLRLLDPISMLRGSGMEFRTQLVRVTARETITHRGGAVSCFRIETDGAIAWADERGRVLRQEVQVPLLGKWVIEDEPYNNRSRLNARKAMMTLREQRVSTRSDQADNRAMASGAAAE